ncbi:protein shisa-7 isoform X5 [Rhinoderma darwinii]|uniref:protein shisa-7 isoform X5 n=1 Tax=Rhinoderma darwinii TaxID=43563 RepID=UPI003F664EB1
MYHLLTVLIGITLDAFGVHSALSVSAVQSRKQMNQTQALPMLLALMKRPQASQNSSSALSQNLPEMCYGYYDVMGQYDATFNCTTGTYRFCCGTCHYRFCCEHRHKRLDQDSCKNYNSPFWAHTTQPITTSANSKLNDNGHADQTNSTVYVICGVISFTLAVGIGAKIAFNKASRRPRGREINVPRALVDILRHQSIPGNHGERNNSTVVSLGTHDNGPSRPPKNLYNPVKSAKSNHGRLPQRATQGARAVPGHQMQGRLYRKEHDNMHHNFILTVNSPKHAATLEKDMDDFYLKRKHLAELTRGTLPLHVTKMNYERDGYLEKSQTPRRVMSQEHILSDNHYPIHHDYTIPRDRLISQERLLSREVLHSQEHLLSPERIHHRGPTPFQEMRLGHQKAVSHTNVCVSTPMLDRHHMIKMNSHPTTSNSPKTTWDMANHTANRRQAFASKRQNTIEQLQFIPGHLPSSQHLRTGSKNEVTV